MNLHWSTGSIGLTAMDYTIMSNTRIAYPFCVEISAEHDGQDIEDWLLENGMGHKTDWLAIKMRHRGVFEVYFKEANKAVMTKLRWSGVGY